jgi:CheY-like chemotaxis protein
MSGAQKGRGKVLVVEDIAVIRLATADMVEQSGFDSAEAGDGREALELLHQDGAITILLTDLGLPGMSGQELVEKALKLKPSLKVIIASGRKESVAGPAGQVTSLLKPFDMQQLREALES